MRNLFIIITLLVSATSCAAEKKFTGVFSNGEGGFKTVTAIIHDNGLAYLSSAVIGQIGEWDFDKSSSTLSIKYFNPSSLEDQTIKLRFNETTHSYLLIKPGDVHSTNSYNKLRFVTNEIPEKILAGFKAYPGWIKKTRSRAFAKRERKNLREEQLEQERPEYERILAQIRKNPRSVLSDEFYVRGETPTTRAFQDSLRDHDFKYPEEVLVGLLEDLPEDNHWIRAIIFSRPELQAETLTLFYPRALEWGKLNYTILSYIAKHPNTPIETIRNLAGRDDLPIGATNSAKDRLKEM